MHLTKRVCVTGGNGYVAQFLIKSLLEKGYTVNATVRNKNNKIKNAVLFDFQQKFPSKLHLFEADLTNRESFDESIQGCTYVFHIASPVFWNNSSENMEELLLKPAREGTENVLSSVIKFKKDVQRVIMTSSVAAILDLQRPKLNYDYTEEDWNETSQIDDIGGAYRLSKVQAEKKAWEICSKNDIELVVINPYLVIGELLNKKGNKDEELNFSCEMIRKYVNGSTKIVPNSYIGMVDVKDVAKALILAAETPEAAGHRFICCAETCEWIEIAKLMKSMYPNYPIPLQKMEGQSIKYNVNNSKIQKILKLKFTPKEVFLKEMIDNLIECGYVEKH